MLALLGFISPSIAITPIKAASATLICDCFRQEALALSSTQSRLPRDWTLAKHDFMALVKPRLDDQTFNFPFGDAPIRHVVAEDRSFGRIFALSDLYKKLPDCYRQRLTGLVGQIDDILPSSDVQNKFSRDYGDLYLLINERGDVDGHAFIDPSHRGKTDMGDLEMKQGDGVKGKGTFLLSAILQDLYLRGIKRLTWGSLYSSANFYFRFLAERARYYCPFPLSFNVDLKSVGRMSKKEKMAQVAYVALLEERCQEVEQMLANLAPGDYELEGEFNDRDSFTRDLKGGWREIVRNTYDFEGKAIDRMLIHLTYDWRARLFAMPENKVVIDRSVVPFGPDTFKSLERLPARSRSATRKSA